MFTSHLVVKLVKCPDKTLKIWEFFGDLVSPTPGKHYHENDLTSVKLYPIFHWFLSDIAPLAEEWNSWHKPEKFGSRVPHLCCALQAFDSEAIYIHCQSTKGMLWVITRPGRSPAMTLPQAHPGEWWHRPVPLTCLWSPPGTDWCCHITRLILDTRNLYEPLITEGPARWHPSHTIWIAWILLQSFIWRRAEA